MRFSHPMKHNTPVRQEAQCNDPSRYTDGTHSREPTHTLLPGDSNITITFSVHPSQSERKTATFYATRKRSHATHSNVHRGERWSNDANTPTKKCALHLRWIRSTAAFGSGVFSGPRDEYWAPSRLNEGAVVPPDWTSTIRHEGVQHDPVLNKHTLFTHGQCSLLPGCRFSSFI